MGCSRSTIPEALSKRLDKVETDVVGPATVTLDVPAGELMAAVAMQAETKERVDLTAQVRDNRLSWQAPAGPWQVMLFVCVPDGARGLVDYLDPEAVRKFVELTYEKYYQTFPEHFGKTIDSAFYDEPTFHWVQGGRAWTPAFNQRFTEKFGHSPGALLSGAVARHRPRHGRGAQCDVRAAGRVVRQRFCEDARRLVPRRTTSS